MSEKPTPRHNLHIPNDNFLANCYEDNIVAKYGPGEGVSYIVGSPRAMPKKSSAELRAMGLVGIYLTGHK